MKKLLVCNILFMAIVASCSDGNHSVNSIEQYVATKSVPVTFGVYKADAAGTRAGTPGVINTTADLQGKSFGVFAYYTKETLFDSVPVTTRSLVPDFMYNEYIKWDATGNEWGYGNPDEKKYWPNDINNGDVDSRITDGAATGTQKNYISFFAYAPYVGKLTQNTASARNGATSAAGDGTASGIIAASGNNFNGDPFLTYRMSNVSTKVVDLLWGTAGGSANGESVINNTQLGGNVTRTVDNGKVTPVTAVDPTNINLTKQKTGGKVVFNFKHALAKVGGSTVGAATTNTKAGLTVDLLIDTNGSTATASKSANTKVTIKKIVISHDTTKTTATPALLKYPMPSTGVFNLATGKWIVTKADSTAATTYMTVNHVIDQTGTLGNVLNADIMEPTTAVTDWSQLSMNGVVESSAKNVYGTEATPLLFLPGTTPHLMFYIEYCVRTKDTKLAKGYTEVWQKITKHVTFAAPVQQNKQYNIAMHLGLTSVKFDATVSTWDVGTTPGGGGGTPSTEIPVDLPINVN